jgi:hypothetical protein
MGYLAILYSPHQERKGALTAVRAALHPSFRQSIDIGRDPQMP